LSETRLAYPSSYSQVKTEITVEICKEKKLLQK